METEVEILYRKMIRGLSMDFSELKLTLMAETTDSRMNIGWDNRGIIQSTQWPGFSQHYVLVGLCLSIETELSLLISVYEACRRYCHTKK